MLALLALVLAGAMIRIVFAVCGHRITLRLAIVIVVVLGLIFLTEPTR